MNDIRNMKFKRKFSVNLYKNKKLKIAEMSFFKDWVNTDRGDPYPITGFDGSCNEEISNGSYIAYSKERFSLKRLIGQFFPFATYEVSGELSEGAYMGISIDTEDGRSAVIYIQRKKDRAAIHKIINGKESAVDEIEFEYTPGMALVVTTHHGDKFDLYLRYGDSLRKVGFFEEEELQSLINEKVFKSTTASVYMGAGSDGHIALKKAEMYLDSGISQADIRPVRYEDGSPVMENGKIFLTMSSRLEKRKYQSVFSWNPSSCEFNLEGALFFDAGDGDWCGDVASSLIYDRNAKNWKIWMCAFSHNHVLGHAEFENDPRFGINVIDIKLSEICPGTTDTDFSAKANDEDPDFFYDKESKKWYMAICRSDSEADNKHYSYFLFESDKPFEGYRFISKTSNDAVTGGSFIKVGNKRFFTCGANFDKRAQYNFYEFPDLTKPAPISCDFDDGGFRGWGTIIAVPCGTRTKYMWITFDRHNGSEIFNWSYGNLYVYEADLMNPGREW